uniref:AAA-ATPase-like domain-containing protein n=1 Tax=Photinus pyralis TaxID=7054 RepID=A0A1Y1MC47_PHOPY
MYCLSIYLYTTLWYNLNFVCINDSASFCGEIIIVLLSHMSLSKRLKMDSTASYSSDPITQVSTEAQDASGDSDGTTHNQKKETRLIFDENEGNFREAVRWIGWVDKSLFIAELLKKPRRVIIFAPRRFGKSLNIDMVKCFFEIVAGRDISYAPKNLEELKEYENFKAFCRYGLSPPCKIIKEEELVKEYFGRHPVVYLDLKDLDCTSKETVKDGLRGIVHDLYVNFSYLMKDERLADSPRKVKAAYEACEAWCGMNTYMREDPTIGLQKLIEYLHAHHKQKVYLLVDEFDAPAVNALLAGKSGGEVKDISNIVMSLLGAVVKGKVADNHLLGSLITGVSYLGSIGISQHLNNIPFYKWLLDDDRFAKYYGVGHEELTTLLESVFPEQKEKQASIQREVLGLYNGYYIKTEAVCCLWSVLHYIRLRVELNASEIRKTNFWAGSSIISALGKVLKNDDVMETMVHVTTGGNFSFMSCDKLDAKDLADFLNGENNQEQLVYSFFMEQGYLSIDPSHRSSRSVKVKAPNPEVLTAYLEMFSNFHVKVCGFSNLSMHKCAEYFESLPDKSADEQEESLSVFYEELKKLLSKFRGQKVKERSIQSLMFVTMLKADFKYCEMEKPVTIQMDGKKVTGFIDLFMENDDCVVIWEFKHIEADDLQAIKDSSYEALKEILFGSQAKKVPYINKMEEVKTKNYILIGLCCGDKGKAAMSCLINNKDINNCISFP